MDRRLDLLFKIFYVAVLTTWLFGYFSYDQAGRSALIIARIGVFIFAVIAIYEIVSVNEVKPLEKILWIFALLLFSILSCTVYYLLGWRKDILEEKYSKYR